MKGVFHVPCNPLIPLTLKMTSNCRVPCKSLIFGVCAVIGRGVLCTLQPIEIPQNRGVCAVTPYYYVIGRGPLAGRAASIGS